MLRKLVFLFLIILNIQVQTNAQEQEDLYNIAIAESGSGKYPVIKDDFIVNSFEGGSGADQINPKIAMDGNGNHAVVWYDFRNGNRDIFIQFYDYKNEKIGSNNRINMSYSRPVNDYSVSASSNGWFIVIWSSGTLFLAQKFSPGGIKQGSIFALKTMPAYNISKPVVAIDDDGSFLITWYGYEYNNWKIYMQYYDSYNNPAENIISDDYTGSLLENQNNVAVDNNNYVVGWHLDNNIYLQKINKNGEKTGNKILISDSSDTREKTFPSICSFGDGHFLICWITSYNNEKTVTGRVYNINSGLFTNTQKDYVSSYYCYLNPIKSICTDRMTNFYLQSESDKNYIWKINKTGERVRIHHNFTTANVNNVSINRELISNTFRNSFYIISTIQNKTNVDIGIEKCDTTVTIIDSVKIVNDDTLSSEQFDPIIYTNEQGYSIIVWIDTRTSVYSLFAQVLDPEFQPVGTNILVSSDEYSSSENKLDIKSFSDGTFVIGCITGSNENRKIYLQLIKTSGEKGLGSHVSTYLNNNSFNIALNINANDEIKVCWYSDYIASAIKLNKELEVITPLKHIYSNGTKKENCILSINKELDMLFSWPGKNYTAEGQLFIYNHIVRDNGETGLDSVNVSYYSPNFFYNQIDDNENILLSWIADSRLNIMRIYPGSYSFMDRIKIGYRNINIHQKADFDNRKGRVVFVDENTLRVITFNDNKEVKKLYTIGDAISPAGTYWNGYSLDLSLTGDKLITVFNDLKNGETGMDIWANVRQVEDVNLDKETFYKPSNDDVLYNNYPNPFNAGTRIAYRLLAPHHVKLSVYDILGREVAVLVDEPQEKGVYEVNFNSAGFASGVYFYKLESFRTVVKKMIIMK